MRLRNFLIITGLIIALLPHLGFSIATENVLFSFVGFVLIVASFYIAALEDKHKHKRIINEEHIQATNEKIGGLISNIHSLHRKIRPEKPQTKNESSTSSIKNIRKEELTAVNEEGEKEEEIFVREDTEDMRPRIKKAVSDVKVKTDSFDDFNT